MLDVWLMTATRQILGVRFFNGDVDEAVASMVRHGGFLVAPSGTCFARLRDDEPYRRAMLAADLAIGDSGLMIVMWRLLRGEKVPRISGLKYLKRLLAKLKDGRTTEIFWVLKRQPQRTRATEIAGLVAPRSFCGQDRQLLCRTALRIGNRRSTSSGAH